MDRNTEAFLRRTKAGGIDNSLAAIDTNITLLTRNIDTARVKSKIWRANMGSRINKRKQAVASLCTKQRLSAISQRVGRERTVHGA
jgi:hypothetical protein